MKKALIIGGTGTISTSVVDLALRKGWNISLLNRGRKPLPAGVHSIVADIHDEAAVARLIENSHYDVVAQFIGFGAEDAERDIRLFTGHTQQYIYVSSASVYQKPLSAYPITESTPARNPYWIYSQGKIAAEDVFNRAYRENGFPVTIVRPSHTYDGTKPCVAIHGNKGVWQIVKRILEEKPVIIPGDGTSLWTLTHASDFAKGFVGLMGNPCALGETYQITNDEVMTWNQIHSIIAATCGKPLNPCHVASDFLAAHQGNYDLQGSLLGDKANSVIFDNTKIKRAVPDFRCTVTMAEGLRQGTENILSCPALQIEDEEFDHWCDEIVKMTGGY
ncbi:MAG: SDR family oxidoreductase [Muribaculaceae bacterium]|nr:SDR family oxidoreductase [Bacteroides sp.]MDE6681544.1 SDR family oxidoreductase [Muribaculaceae bacterium]MDE6842991.1 SDR family oxidoreductase [Muribaculaceae bacterium]